jgi:cation:H+ antiporter
MAALLAGLALLLISAKYFVDGIARIAAVLGVPPLVIGMTLVAFGTSTPELVVNLLSASRGETALAFGNIVGSCTVNLGFVLAVTAIFRPLRVETSIITREIPMLMLSVAALLILSFDRLWNAGGNGGGDAVDRLGRADGLMLLLLFGVFLYYTVIYTAATRLLSKDRPAADGFIEDVEQREEAGSAKPRGMTATILVTLAGLAGVSLGADWTVDGATAMARAFGIAENIIGLTIVSVGTTLPELVTCILAAKRGNPDIALGNVVGSNIFNILAIGGGVAAIHPIELPPGGWIDLAFVGLLTVILLPIAIRSGKRIVRGEGAVFLALYLGYLAYRLTH